MQLLIPIYILQYEEVQPVQVAEGQMAYQRVPHQQECRGKKALLEAVEAMIDAQKRLNFVVDTRYEATIIEEKTDDNQ